MDPVLSWVPILGSSELSLGWLPSPCIVLSVKYVSAVWGEREAYSAAAEIEAVSKGQLSESVPAMGAV